jgi:RNA polymerase sigma-70 factor, ECF subfamily
MAMDQTDTHLPPEALQHLDALYTLARWFVRDPSEAGDLVQETYLRALRGAHQFQAGTNLRAWLFQILRNTFYTLYRRKGREPQAIDPEVLDSLPQGGSAGRADHLERTDGTLGVDLTAALAQLPEDLRSVVLLADLEDFTMSEVAGIMACPVGTVKSRLFRARAILKDLLRDYVH